MNDREVLFVGASISGTLVVVLLFWLVYETGYRVCEIDNQLCSPYRVKLHRSWLQIEWIVND